MRLNVASEINENVGKRNQLLRLAVLELYEHPELQDGCNKQ